MFNSFNPGFPTNSTDSKYPLVFVFNYFYCCFNIKYSVYRVSKRHIIYLYILRYYSYQNLNSKPNSISYEHLVLNPLLQDNLPLKHDKELIPTLL